MRDDDAPEIDQPDTDAVYERYLETWKCRELRHCDARNLTFESRYADFRLERLPDLAATSTNLRARSPR
jgi:hypothetical protein